MHRQSHKQYKKSIRKHGHIAIQLYTRQQNHDSQRIIAIRQQQEGTMTQKCLPTARGHYVLKICLPTSKGHYVLKICLPTARGHYVLKICLPTARGHYVPKNACQQLEGTMFWRYACQQQDGTMLWRYACHNYKGHIIITIMTNTSFPFCKLNGCSQVTERIHQNGCSQVTERIHQKCQLHKFSKLAIILHGMTPISVGSSFQPVTYNLQDKHCPDQKIIIMLDVLPTWSSVSNPSISQGAEIAKANHISTMYQEKERDQRSSSCR